jgi:hypothetical protein
MPFQLADAFIRVLSFIHFHYHTLLPSDRGNAKPAFSKPTKIAITAFIEILIGHCDVVFPSWFVRTVKIARRDATANKLAKISGAQVLR